MEILLMGGTGAMGSHLVKILENGSHNIYVTTRREKKNSNNINYIKGNAHDVDFMDTLLGNKRYDVIVDFMVYSTTEFKNRIALLLDGCNHYFYISSARVYENAHGTPITETTSRLLDESKDEEYLKTDEYALKKARQEDFLKNSGRNNWTIIRPYITFDENRLQLGAYEKEQWAYRPLMGLPIVFSKDIAKYYTTMTYGGDVAKAIAQLITNPNAKGETINVTTNERFTWKEILDIYIEVFKEETGVAPQITLTEKSSKLRFKDMRYQVKYCRCTHRIFDNTKLLKFCPGLEFSPVKDKLRQCLRGIINNTRQKNISSFDYALLDKDCRRFTPLSFFCGKEKIKYMIFRLLPCSFIDFYINRKNNHLS